MVTKENLTDSFQKRKNKDRDDSRSSSPKDTTMRDSFLSKKLTKTIKERARHSTMGTTAKCARKPDVKGTLCRSSLRGNKSFTGGIVDGVTRKGCNRINSVGNSKTISTFRSCVKVRGRSGASRSCAGIRVNNNEVAKIRSNSGKSDQRFTVCRTSRCATPARKACRAIRSMSKTA